MHNNISKHIGHDIEIVERDGVVDLRCKTCKQGIMRVDKKYEGRSSREERVIKDILKITQTIGYRFPSEEALELLAEEMIKSGKEGESFFSMVYENINRRIRNKTIEPHYFALAMSEVYNLPIVAAKQYGDKGYDEIYVDISGSLISTLENSTMSKLEGYVGKERGKYRKMYKYLKDSGVPILEGELRETKEYVKENVEVKIKVKTEVETLVTHTEGKKEILKMKSGRSVPVKQGYEVVILGWL